MWSWEYSSSLQTPGQCFLHCTSYLWGITSLNWNKDEMAESKNDFILQWRKSFESIEVKFKNNIKIRNTFQNRVIFLSFLVASSLIILQNSGPLIGTAKWQGAKLYMCSWKDYFSATFEAEMYAFFLFFCFLFIFSLWPHLQHMDIPEARGQIGAAGALGLAGASLASCPHPGLSSGNLGLPASQGLNFLTCANSSDHTSLWKVVERIKPYDRCRESDSWKMPSTCYFFLMTFV